MDFEPVDTPELGRFRVAVRDFLKQIVPSELVISADPEQNSDDQYEMRREIARQLGEKGWLFPLAPPEYGGGGLSLEHAVIIAEELDTYELSAPPYTDVAFICGPPIEVWGTEAQKQRFLPLMYTGQAVTWQLLTEPHGGSDVASPKTTAVRDGDEYVVNGSKIFVGDDRKPDLLYTLALTDPEGPRHQNLSWLVIPADTPGITIQPLDILAHTMGPSFLVRYNCSVFLDDVRVPAANLIGGENNGWQVASTHLEMEHGGGGSVRRDRVTERFLDYCKHATLDDQPLSQHPDVRHLLADVIIESEVNRLLNVRNFWMSSAGIPQSYEGSQSSYIRKMSGLRIAQTMQKIVGYSVLTNDDIWGAADKWMELYMRASIAAVHPGGTQDIQAVIMARRMGIGRMTGEDAGHVERSGAKR